MQTYHLTEGGVPLLISMPHNGFKFPSEIQNQFQDNALKSKDTDWFLDRLYDFCTQLNCSILTPTYSRYVIDLNRSTEGECLYPGQDTTELCPLTAFDYSPLYQEDKSPDPDEIKRRVERYWFPYHNALQNELIRLKSVFGKVVLFEAHTIASQVPRFFDGKLPDFNFGTNNGESCSENLINYIQSTMHFHPFEQVFNGRFKGGYITRHYGKPDKNIHAIQLELSQATYLNESTLQWDEEKSTEVKIKLEQLINSLLDWIIKS